jgi:GMP synthase (glutamine-hydrolysing)
MAIVSLEHFDRGGPGRIGMTFRDHGFTVDSRRPDLNPIGSRQGVPTDLDNLHGLIIMGGPQNVTDLHKYPWMQTEVELIKNAHAAEIPIIGVCLGAQLIAHALGGKVAPRSAPAIGFYPMDLTLAGQIEPLLGGIPWRSPQLFSCGPEVTDMPAGATLLASTPNTKHAMFRLGLRTFASIAHYECDRPYVNLIMAASKDQIAPAGKSPEGITAESHRDYPMYARASDRICVNLATYLFPLRRKLAV